MSWLPTIVDKNCDTCARQLKPTNTPRAPTSALPPEEHTRLAGEAAPVLLTAELRIVAERKAEPGAERELQTRVLPVEARLQVEAWIAEREAAGRGDRRPVPAQGFASVKAWPL